MDGADTMTSTALDAMRQRMETLEGEFKELQRDALRWRWWRQQRGWREVDWGTPDISPQQYDAMADEALKREGIKP
jgi:hypothetical protein